MNPWLHQLHPYPFEKLATLFSGSKPAADKNAILWSIGEPKHSAPAFIHDVISREISGLGTYPLTAGSTELREAIRDWLQQAILVASRQHRREKQIIPVNGTREALFAFCHFRHRSNGSRNRVCSCQIRFIRFTKVQPFLPARFHGT